jgi:hypothetical protein
MVHMFGRTMLQFLAKAWLSQVLLCNTTGHTQSLYPISWPGCLKHQHVLFILKANFVLVKICLVSEIAVMPTPDHVPAALTVVKRLPGPPQVFLTPHKKA